MLTSRDVLLRSDKMYSVWQLGMKESSMTKDEIMAANIKSIADEVIQNQEGLVFHLSGLLLRGIAILYSKKTDFAVLECNEALARISLKSDKETQPKDHSKSKEKSRSENGVDETALKAWENLQPIESIIETEKNDIHEPASPHLTIIENPAPTPVQVSPPRVVDDFGDSFELAIPSQPIREDEVDEQMVIPMDNDNENSTSETKTRSNRTVVDPTPVIPLPLVAKMLEDVSSTLCERGCMKRTPDYPLCSKELSSLFSDRGSFARRQLDVKQSDIEDLVIPEEPIAQSPAPRFDEDVLATEYRASSLDILPQIRTALKEAESVELYSICPQKNRKYLAAAMYSALALHSDGVIVLTQSSFDSPISITVGPNIDNQ